MFHCKNTLGGESSSSSYQLTSCSDHERVKLLCGNPTILRLMTRICFLLYGVERVCVFINFYYGMVYAKRGNRRDVVLISWHFSAYNLYRFWSWMCRRSWTWQACSSGNSSCIEIIISVNAATFLSDSLVWSKIRRSKNVMVRLYRDELVLEKFKRKDNGGDRAELPGPVDRPSAWSLFYKKENAWFVPAHARVVWDWLWSLISYLVRKRQDEK